MRYSVVSNLANSSSNPKDALGTILLLFRQKPYEYPFSSNSPFKSWHISAIFSILPSFHLPGFHFSLSGKYFLVFPLAWIPFFPLRQVFPRLSTCLDSIFPSQASISPPFHLPGLPFLPLRQVFPRLSTCLDSVFPSQASIFSSFHLPGFRFSLSGKYFLAFPLAWIPFFPLRQVELSWKFCPICKNPFWTVSHDRNLLSK